MLSPTQQLGLRGQELAAIYLQRKNYRIIERNFLTPVGEIDLITFDKDKKMIVFVEVKTLRHTRQTSRTHPEQAVTPYKLRNLQRVINRYLQLYGIRRWRLDVIGITLDDTRKKAQVRHVLDIGWQDVGR
jgi:putative endonuclease